MNSKRVCPFSKNHPPSSPGIELHWFNVLPESEYIGLIEDRLFFRSEWPTTHSILYGTRRFVHHPDWDEYNLFSNKDNSMSDTVLFLPGNAGLKREKTETKRNDLLPGRNKQHGISNNPYSI
ncbi:MAG TPA: hypothetical protein VNZ86_07390 [Bacteroidia bacterium]|nr:hypothetical protein [Bacteroidia bacterium]